MAAIVPLTALETGLGWLVNASWQAAVLGLVVLLVSRPLRGRLEARWHFGLWLVVLARLALPFTPAAPWSLFHLVPTAFLRPATDTPAGDPVAVPPSTSNDQGPPIVVATPAEGAAEAVAPPVHPAEPGGEATDGPLVTPGQGLAVVWLVGVIVLLLRQGWLSARLHRQRCAWRDASDPVVLDVFRRCRQELEVVRPVRLLIATGNLGPATLGILRPCIVLPARLLPGLSPEELRLVLLHELTHVRRRDVLLDRAAGLLVALHWFNPVAWLALARLRCERELACDAAVLRRLGGDEAGRYGHALLKVAEQMSAPALQPGAVAGFGKDRSLVRRIHMIADYRKPTMTATALGGLLLVVVGLLGLTGAAPRPAHKAETDEGRPGVAAKDIKPVTVAGICQDERGKPVSGAGVVLYREDYEKSKAERVQSAVTGADGRFQFRELPPPPGREERRKWDYALAITSKGHGSILQTIDANRLTAPLTFTLRPAATLQGRVTDAKGKPVAGARVWANSLRTEPIQGVCSTQTDADGRYAITDMVAWGPDVLKPRATGKGEATTITGCYFDVRHPDYGHKRPMYRRMPDTVHVVLEPAGIITGRVVDQVTGKPAAGVWVCMQGTHKIEGGGWHQTRTDSDGKYRFSSLLAGTYNLWAMASDRTCAAIDSFAVTAGKTHEAPNLLLIEGGWIEGRLVDAQTGKAISGRVTDGRLHVGLYGPSRPKSGAAAQSSEVDDRGRFRLRVAPGVNYPYLMHSDYWVRIQRREFFAKGIEVKSGEVVSVVFRLLPTRPIPDPDPTPVRFPVPVPAERQAAARVRQLGGWYKVDAANHVVEVNMVFHETPGGQRFENDRTDTDEALRAMSAFSRLKRVYLANGQASDDGLRSLSKLNDLEVVFVWNATHVTDAGVKHLAGLRKLKELHFDKGQLGDASLAVFSRLPELRTLSLQGNAFSDSGLKHLVGLKELRSLFIGWNRRPITDAGVQYLGRLSALKRLDLQGARLTEPEARHLAGLTELEYLDLNGARLTDASVAALKNLKQLRRLHLTGAGDGNLLTDASIEHLVGMTKLQELWILNSRLTDQGVQRLLALPDLKDLWLPPKTISEELQDKLKRQRPGLRVMFATSP